jgi:predicted transcriptional regulator
MKLAEWMRRRGLTQADVAHRLGISQGHVSRLLALKRGARMSAGLAAAIKKETRGAVTAAAWAQKATHRPARNAGRSAA